MDKYYEKNKEEILAKRRKNYRENSESIRGMHRILAKKWYQKNKDKKSYPNLSPEQQFKTLVRRKVQYAVKIGKIIKPNTCEKCKNKTEVYQHHTDYEKPLDVIWVCRPCHSKIHRKYDWDTDELL